MNAAGIQLLKLFEGWRPKAYPDPGTGGAPWTIGYGFTRGVRPGDTMTLAEGEARLIREVEEYENGVKAAAGTATENQLAAMTCFAYNVGLTGFRGSSVLRHHKAGKFAAAADAFKMWNRAAGREMAGLTRRRQAELELYLS
jgi:lysozyme